MRSIVLILGLGFLALGAVLAPPLLVPEKVWPSWTEAAAGLDQMLASTSDPATPGRARAMAQVALLAQEDDRLFDRQLLGVGVPVDARACVRALVANLGAGRVRQGCSTLPMTLAKTAIPEAQRYDRTLSRKLLQVRLAVRTAQAPPAQVVQAFLDHLPCGSDLAQGIEPCALLYFGRPVDQLNDAEAMLLATAIQAPARDLRDPEKARARVNRVLGRMMSLGWISAEEAAAVAAQPLGLGVLHPHLVRAAQDGSDLQLTQALGVAVDAARLAVQDKQGSPEDLVVVGMVFEADGTVAARAGAGPGWFRRPFEAGSWVKPWCAQGLLETPGVGAAYLSGASIPLKLPLYDRNLRRYTPANAARNLPQRGVPMTWLVRSVNTATLAAVLYAQVYMPEAELRALHQRSLSAKERRRWTGATDRRLSLGLASAYAGMSLSAQEVPGLPGYRAMTLAGVRTCLGPMKRDVPALEVPTEDLAALLGVVRAPLEDLGRGMTQLWLDDGQPTPLARLMAQWGRGGTLGRTMEELDLDLAAKTASAERNAGLMIQLPLQRADGSPRNVVLLLAAARPGGGPIDPILGGHLAPGIPAFVAALEQP